ncbi:MAG: hypothetical protein ACSHW0_02155 [Thalassotalea sp.]
MNSETNNTSPLTALTSQYGVSDSLKAMFEGLRETPGLSGDKFRRQDVNKFAQYIVCRNYGKLCLELSYLLFALIKYPSALEPQPNKLLAFFWLDENFSPARFRQYFTQPFQTESLTISLSAASLTINTNVNVKQHSFAISPTRAGVLAVLYEFLMMIKPALIEQTDTMFSVNDAGEAEIKALSSALQKLLYEFLAEHLSNAQTQRRFRFITQWLHSQSLDSQKPAKQKVENSVYEQEFLTDENVLSFWQMASTSDTSLSFKLYSSALADLIGVDQAIKQTQQMHEIEQHLTIGDHHQTGELSADVLYQQVFEQCQTQTDYEFLIKDPKFLTKNQWQVIKPFIDYPLYQPKLALSFARQAIFSQWQASIVQAKRQSSEQLQLKLAQLPTDNYVTYQQVLVQLQQSIDDVLMAIIYIYLQAEVSEGLSGLLSKLAPVAAAKVKQQLQQALIKMSKGDANKPDAQRLFSAFTEVLITSTTLQQVEHSVKKAFQKNNKAGFKTLPDIADLDVYREGVSALQHCEKLLAKQKQVFAQIWQDDEHCLADFRSDAFIFKQSFENIYGVGVANNGEC